MIGVTSTVPKRRLRLDEVRIVMTRICKFAHELNNSLTIINGHAELLKNELRGNEKVSFHIDAVQEAVRHAAEIIDSCQCAVAYSEYVARAGESGSAGPSEIELRETVRTAAAHK